ncbi:MAG: hypothetical protein HYW77_00365 [Parcubacteria group bacterium]|nr:hypothetical protein [Parcubacteria group bacterium]
MMLPLFLVILTKEGFVVADSGENKDKNQAVVIKLLAWQNAGFIHEMNCPSGHLLSPTIEAEKVFLFCHVCKFKTETIPEIVLNLDLKSLEELIQRLREGKVEEI